MKKTIALILAAVMSLSVFAGCGNTDTPSSEANANNGLAATSVDSSESVATELKTDAPINLTIVLGNTKNSPEPDVSLLSSEIDQLAAYGGSLTVVVDDGSPVDNFHTIHIDPPDKDKTPAVQEKIKEQTKKSLNASILSLKPKANETNTLQALQVASNNAPNDGIQSCLVVFDNGIQTTGVFPMKNLGTVNSEKDNIIEKLKNDQNIPSLSKFNEIVWFGIGATVGEQKAPANADIAGLKAYYLDVFNAGGYNCNNVENIFSTVNYAPSNKDRSDLPEVQVVNVTIDTIPEPEPDSEPEPLDDTIRVDFPEETFEFEPNSAKLKDPEKAKKNAEGVVNFLNLYSKDIVLIGTTATIGEVSTSIALSKQRAEAIAEILIQLGVDENRISCFGGGYSDSDLVAKDISNGVLIESIAQTNRSVHLISSENPIAQKYIDGTFKPM